MTTILGTLLALSALTNVGLALWAFHVKRAVPFTIDRLQSLHEGRARISKELVHGLQVENEELQRKCREYFAQIDVACEQRNFWQRWYHRQASEHSHAQAYLLRCVQALMIQYHKKTGEQPHMDALAEEIVREFGDAHPTLANAGQEPFVPARASEPAPLKAESAGT